MSVGAGQRRAGTRPELLLRNALVYAGSGYFEVDTVVLPRVRPDIVFRAARVAVFVDGCFWHGCPWHSRPTKTNTNWWGEKIRGNRERDERQNLRLRGAGWVVVRVWEHTPVEQSVSMVMGEVHRCA